MFSHVRDVFKRDQNYESLVKGRAIKYGKYGLSINEHYLFFNNNGKSMTWKETQDFARKQLNEAIPRGYEDVDKVQSKNGKGAPIWNCLSAVREVAIQANYAKSDSQNWDSFWGYSGVASFLEKNPNDWKEIVNSFNNSPGFGVFWFCNAKNEKPTFSKEGVFVHVMYALGGDFACGFNNDSVIPYGYVSDSLYEAYCLHFASHRLENYMEWVAVGANSGCWQLKNCQDSPAIQLKYYVYWTPVSILL